jgi:hypothetical protein
LLSSAADGFEDLEIINSGSLLLAEDSRTAAALRAPRPETDMEFPYMPVDGMNRRCRPPAPMTAAHSPIAWFALWLALWTFHSMRDPWVRYKAIDEMALEIQRRR